jgi:hypothetical protein
MDLYMKDGGEIIKLMAKVDLFIRMEMYMKGNGVMIKPMALVNILTKMGEQSILALGRMINSMGLAWKHGLMELSMKEVIVMALNKD